MNNRSSTALSPYRQSREKLESEFLAEPDAGKFLSFHTRLVDRLIDKLAQPFLDKHQFCVLATAGYGRRELFPRSDVDLLIVHPWTDETKTEAAIGPFIRLLWDTFHDLGHQVWSLDDLNHLVMDDYQFVLALTDSRIVTGEAEIGRCVLEERLPHFLSRNQRSLVEAIVGGLRSRHDTFGNTIYQVEPDLKEAPGGLRDHLAAGWLERFVGEPGYLPHKRSEIRSAKLFLAQLRIALHILTGWNDNRLTHRMQEKIRKFVGFGGRTRMAVEALMKEYFLKSRVINSYCSVMLNLASPPHVENPLDCTDLGSAPAAPVKILELFQRSLDEERIFTDALREKVSNALPKAFEQVSFPDLRGALEALFLPRQGLYRVLSEMYGLGLLELLFPEFANTKARVVRDFYHKYTVDEHTLLAIKHIEELTKQSGREGPDGRFGKILEDTVSADFLTLALLFHDVGKGKGGKHADQSARMASRALRRYQFPQKSIDTIVFLIRHHLAMSAVVFRRDLEDQQVIDKFANLVGDPEQLRLLTLVTYADIKAVAPGTLNDWKKDLLWQLYVSAYRKLTLEYGGDRIEEQDIEERLLERLDPSLDRFHFERFLEGFPTRYLRTKPKEIYQHYQLAARLDATHPVQSRIWKRKTFYELCVVTPDRSRLFAKIVGLLSYFEMNIFRGYGFANSRQTILDFFEFFDPKGAFRHSSERERFHTLLQETIQDEASVRRLLEGKERSVLYRRPGTGFEATVYFEDDPRGRFTILEIIASDCLGLLYRISSEIAALDCDIEMALISTEGEKAVDVFYVYQRGKKLDAELKEMLAQRIIHATR